MQTIENEMSPAPVKVNRVKRVIVVGTSALASAAAMIGPVAAETDINGTITPILSDVIELLPTIIALIISAVPAIIVISVVAFITGFLDSILAKIGIR